MSKSSPAKDLIKSIRATDDGPRESSKAPGASKLLLRQLKTGNGPPKGSPATGRGSRSPEEPELTVEMLTDEAKPAVVLWSVDDVLSWLDRSFAFGHLYTERFRALGVDGRSLLEGTPMAEGHANCAVSVGPGPS